MLFSKVAIMAIQAFGLTVLIATTMYMLTEIIIWLWDEAEKRYKKIKPENLTETQRAEWLYTRRVK